MCLVAFQCCKRCHRNFKFALTNCDPVMLAGHNRSRTTNMFIYTSPSFALYPECRFLEVYWRALVRGLCLSCFEAKNPDKPDAWDPWYGSDELSTYNQTYGQLDWEYRNRVNQK